LFILRIPNPVLETDDTVNSNVIFAAVQKGTVKITFLLRTTTKVVFSSSSLYLHLPEGQRGF